MTIVILGALAACSSSQTASQVGTRARFVAIHEQAYSVFNVPKSATAAQTLAAYTKGAAAIHRMVGQLSALSWPMPARQDMAYYESDLKAYAKAVDALDLAKTSGMVPFLEHDQDRIAAAAGWAPLKRTNP